MNLKLFITNPMKRFREI